MPVLEQITEQITEASDKFFDVAESTNDRAHVATKSIVTRIQDGDVPFAERLSSIEVPFANRLCSIEVPFADRLSNVNVPFIDKLPVPIEAVDAYFGFMSNGIESNRAFAEKVMSRFVEAPAPVEAAPAKPAPAKPAPAAKKTTAKKTAAKKTAAKKTTAKKTTAKKATATTS